MALPERVDGWISEGQEDTAVALVLERAQIGSDRAYLACRHLLCAADRLRADRRRLQYFADISTGAQSSDPLPLYLIDASLTKIRAVPSCSLILGVRATNCIRVGRLSTIGEIVDKGLDGLLAIKNCGKKTVTEITAAIWRLTGDWLNGRGNFQAEMRGLDGPDNVDIEGPGGAVSGAAAETGESLIVGLRNSMAQLPEKDQIILRGRFGLSGRVETLEQLGRILGVTRERIRQIEARSIEGLLKSAQWPQLLRVKMADVLRTATEPAWLVLAPMWDPFFEGFEPGEVVLERLIEVFGGGESHCFEIEGARLVARISGEEFAALRQQFLHEVRTLVPKRPTRFELEVLAESRALNAGARELYAEIMKAAEGLLHFARPPGVAEEMLVAYGRGAEQIVIEVLEEAETPLHYSEVHSRVEARCGEVVEIRRVHNALNQPSVFAFGRGVYGLRRHLNFSDSEMEELREAAEEVVLSGGPNRQWHAQEIIDQLPFDSGFDLSLLNPYTLHLILANTRRLRYLNRMIWVAESSEYRSSADRIDIAQACTRILRDAGRPLTRNELLASLSDWRGIGRHFQIHSTDEVVSIAPGVWGLKSRDIPLTSAEVEEILDAVARRLAQTGEGLHQSELKPALKTEGLLFANDLDAYWVLSLAGADSRFHVVNGGYVGLSSWGSTRRFTPAAAAKSIRESIVNATPMRELLPKIQSLAKRELGKLEVAAALRSAGFEFDGETDLWKVAPIEATEAM